MSIVTVDYHWTVIVFVMLTVNCHCVCLSWLSLCLLCLQLSLCLLWQLPLCCYVYCQCVMSTVIISLMSICMFYYANCNWVTSNVTIFSVSSHCVIFMWTVTAFVMLTVSPSGVADWLFPLICCLSLLQVLVATDMVHATQVWIIYSVCLNTYFLCIRM